MKLIEVIPISRGINKETLTYFSIKNVAPGSVVIVPVRGRAVPALAVASFEVGDAKAFLRSLEYPMKKLDARTIRPFFSEAFIGAAREMADYSASTTGSVLSAAVSGALFDAALSGTRTAKTIISHRNTVYFSKATHGYESLLLHANEGERFAHYKNLIREDFARNLSVFLFMPTLAEMERPIVASLIKDIERYAFFLHGSLSRAEQVRRIRAFLIETHSVLLVATGGFLGVPRHDIGTVVIEQEASRAYKSISQPYIDVRALAEMYARHARWRIIFGGGMLRTETVWRYKKGEIIDYIPLKFRMGAGPHPEARRIIDMRRRVQNSKIYDPILSPELKEMITRASARGEQVFLFAARRGLAPLTICSDCDTPVLCDRCSAPRVLHSASTASAEIKKEKTRDNVFLCHKCGALSSADIHCGVCGGWRFAMLGIGSERVAETIETLFPSLPLFRVDTDTTRTHKQTRAVMQNFFSTPGSVLVGTERALSHLIESVPHVAVVSLDSLFALPDFSINERVLGIIQALRSHATETLLIQTRNPEQRSLAYALEGNLAKFYRDELAERKALNYPPFSRLIKITRVGAREQVLREMESVRESLAAFHPYIFPAFTATVKGKYGMHALIKIPRNEWPGYGVLLKKLRALPPQYAVNVDPENVL